MARDLIQLLTDDHRQVEEIFGRIHSGEGDRRELVAELVRELSRHDHVERGIVYPIIQHTVHAGRTFVARAVEEHQRIVEILVGLDGAEDVDSAQAREALGELRAEVAGHVAEEEGEMFPQLRRTLSPRELSEMAKEVAEAKEAAPTHPHRLPAPGVGVSRRIEGSAVAGFDHLRDSGR